jgi:hypothetical protein
MAFTQTAGDRVVGTDIRFQIRQWKVQRYGWAGLAATLLLALLGLFGNGPMSSRTVGAPGGPAWLEHDHFARSEAPTELKVRVGAGASREGKLTVRLSAKYLEGVRVESVSPQPESVALGRDDHAFVFPTEAPDGPATVVFRVEHEGFGNRSGWVRVGDADPLLFRQFVYP